MNTVATLPGTGASELIAGGTAWTNPTYIQAEANAATCAITAFSYSYYLRASNFGFDIPLSAGINGIKVEISRKSSAVDTLVDSTVYLVNASGTSIGDNKARTITEWPPEENIYWPTSQTSATYGGESDLWGTSLSPTIVNDADFGVRLIVTTYDEVSTRTASVYWIKITVYYSLAAGTATIYSSASDGHIVKDGTVYADVWAGTTGGTIVKATSTMYLGQRKTIIPPPYGIFRPFLFYDTSSIPTEATITLATLNLYGYLDYSTTDFNITVQNGQPTYPHDPLVVGDYNKANYSGDGGSLSTSGFITTGYNTITLNSDGRSWVTKGGQTKLCIRSDRDIAGTTPTGDEFVVIYSNEEAGYQPYLYIEYTIPLQLSSVTDWKTPGACVTSARDGSVVGWTNYSGAMLSDDNYATASIPVGYTDWLRCTEFNFDDDIPVDSWITGIDVKIERKAGAATLSDSALYLRKDVQFGANKASATEWLTEDTEVIYSWNWKNYIRDFEIVPDTDITDNTFGVDFSVASTGETTASVDCIHVRAYYFPASHGVYL